MSFSSWYSFYCSCCCSQRGKQTRKHDARIILGLALSMISVLLSCHGCVCYIHPNFNLRRSRSQHSSGRAASPLSPSSVANSTISSSSSTTSTHGGFYDEATIYVRAGSGGQGASTHRTSSTTGSGSTAQGKPNGGQGGKGGDIILQLDSSINTLAHLNYASYRPNAFGGAAISERRNNNNRNANWIRSFRAENGQDGNAGFKNGKWADDWVICVPSGTIVEELFDDEDEPRRITAAPPTELSFETNVTSIILARGGEGGDGNAGGSTSAVSYASGGRGNSGKRRRSPQGGERKRFKLVLKIVGDVAIVGLPNAGKSTFLASVTRAKPRIANYPFTTVIPNLGVWVDNDHQQYNNNGNTSLSSLVLCDVPGLISGAADGVGLGHAFLRHVERCHILLHIVDATSDDPLLDFDVINHELTRYNNGCLVNKPQIVVVNKIDAWNYEDDITSTTSNSVRTRVKLSRRELEQGLLNKMSHTRLMFMSASEKEGVDELMHRLAIFTKKVKAASVDIIN